MSSIVRRTGWIEPAVGFMPGNVTSIDSRRLASRALRSSCPRRSSRSASNPATASLMTLPADGPLAGRKGPDLPPDGGDLPAAPEEADARRLELR